MTGRKLIFVAVGHDSVAIPVQEEAFYEILSKHRYAWQDFDLIRKLVRKILVEVKKIAFHPYCYKRRHKANFQLAVKKVLRYKAKAALQEILDEVMEQAKAQYKAYDLSKAYKFSCASPSCLQPCNAKATKLNTKCLILDSAS